MARYRCYLLDGSARIVAFDDIEANTLDEALAAARRLLAERQSSGLELWLGRERLHKEGRIAACA